MPTMSFLIGITLLHESFDGPNLIGFAVVWVGVAIFAADLLRRPQAV
jgi:EamA domain-containing membrane protein RarD